MYHPTNIKVSSPNYGDTTGSNNAAGVSKRTSPNAEAMSVAQGDVVSDITEQHRRPFTIFTAIGLGYSTTNTAAGILLTVTATLPFGGAPMFFWGFLAITPIVLCVAITLGEFASMWPHSGGQYVWVSRLAPENSRRFLSYLTAIISWASAVCISAACALASSNTLFSMVSFTYPEIEAKPWRIFVMFQVLNAFAFGANCFEALLPILAQLFMLLTAVIAGIIFVALFAAGSPTVTPHEFFLDYRNVSGWPDGVAFLIGINGLNWSFSCLDAITHLADEIPNPRKNIPRALMWTIIIGAITGLLIVIALFVCATDLENNNNTLLIFYSVIDSNRQAALGLQSLVFITAYSSLVGIHTWQSRIAWALSKDYGLPFYSYLSRIAPAPFGTPIYAHLFSATWTAICGCLYLGSQTAFSSFVAGSIILQYATYALPVGLLLWRGRSSVAHGPFWYPKLGLFANIVTLVWFSIILVFYSLPYFLPVTASDMNYVSAVIFGVLAYALGYWLLHGHKNYVLPGAGKSEREDSDN
ncbi:amino acid/polyamine transporter I [Boeremia exigua]|uniref:amino acid/polyamine transporter I n=1 Tax=Boeremia exigua TaxID=749465 RepID=UPI001E8D02D4|nr:amino acid/polyamine transporter I [Boeremia exigua]KAH6628988.1 amino acid/polyamine transporter I [Boeremia exigua]